MRHHKSAAHRCRSIYGWHWASTDRCPTTRVVIRIALHRLRGSRDRIRTMRGPQSWSRVVTPCPLPVFERGLMTGTWCHPGIAYLCPDVPSRKRRGHPAIGVGDASCSHPLCSCYLQICYWGGPALEVSYGLPGGGAGPVGPHIKCYYYY